MDALFAAVQRHEDPTVLLREKVDSAGRVAVGLRWHLIAKFD
jgi:hypothetical protein